MGNMLGKNFWSKHFLPSTLNIRLMMDKSVANIFTTVYHKVKLKPVLHRGQFVFHKTSENFLEEILLICPPPWLGE